MCMLVYVVQVHIHTDDNNSSHCTTIGAMILHCSNSDDKCHSTESFRQQTLLLLRLYDYYFTIYFSHWQMQSLLYFISFYSAW